MSRPSIPQISAMAITLRVFPPPQNITQSRAVLKTLQRFGQVTAFKALRFPTSIPTYTPTVHAMFANENSVKAVMAAAPLKVEGTGIEIQVMTDEGTRWGGREHEDYLRRANKLISKEQGGMEMLGVIRATGGGFGVSGRRIGEEGSGKGIQGMFKIGNKSESKKE